MSSMHIIYDRDTGKARTVKLSALRQELKPKPFRPANLS